MIQNKRINRLARVWNTEAVYFLTVCTHNRKRMLTGRSVTDILIDEFSGSLDRHGWMIGRYVIMPDHVHFFCAEQRGGAIRNLSGFMRHWKEWTSKRLCKERNFPAPIWQKQFFDHVLRSDDSYSEKWMYVRENPVRAGLVSHWCDWPYQGHVHFDSPLQERDQRSRLQKF